MRRSFSALKAGNPVSRRSILLGLALIPPSAWWLAQIEYVRYSDTPTIPALFFHCIATLFLLRGFNTLLQRKWPKFAFSSQELLVVYALQVIGSNLAGHDQLQILFTTLAWVLYRATPENRWEQYIHPHLPKSLIPTDYSALDHLFRGNSSLYVEGNWKTWWLPLSIWTLFLLILVFTMYCLASLFRRQWDYERLTYPLAQVPLAVADPEGGTFRQWPFWLAFTLASGVEGLNLLHFLWPTVPGLPLGVRYFILPQRPWSAMGAIPICFYPFAFGITFLLPTQLAFSCILCFLFTRMELVLSEAFAWREPGGFPYVQEQGTGAYLAFALFVIWNARHHLRQIFQRTFRGQPLEDSEESLPYPLALLGSLAGILFLLGFLVLYGERWWVALFYLSLFFMLVLTCTRLRVEIGLPTIELYQRGTDDLLNQVIGTRNLTPRELTLHTLLFFENRTHRQFPMGHQLHALRLAQQGRLHLRSLTLPLLFASLLGILCAFWALLHVTYQTGLGSARFTGPANWAFGNEPWMKLASWLQNPSEPRWGAIGAYSFGAGITVLLAILRAKFLWWPIHPAGWVVASSFALMRLWLPLSITWLIKTLILRYSGLQGYRRAFPFFLGLVIGDFTFGFLRTLLDLTFHLYLPVDSGIGGL